MFTPEVIKAAKNHARHDYPNESCGLVIDNVYWPIKNISPNPRTAFAMPDTAWPVDAEVQAVIHSHTNGNVAPTEPDIAGQIRSAAPWGLIIARSNEVVSDPFFFGDGHTDHIPLLGRTWRNGPTGTDNAGDCYALVRDYYRREKSIRLNDYPRNEDWLADGHNFFVDNFEREGFEQISADELQPGDCFLMAVLSKGVPNHCGVYVGNGLGMHHLMNRLSRREPLHTWRKFITHYLRYTGNTSGG
jgi:proteasome lid subunit RPN8/RPN11